MVTQLLTIVIPTFNRSRYLSEVISEIVTQVVSDDLYDYVSIHINDNSSTDNTADLVMRFIEQNNCKITYHRNHTNLGFDRNCDVAIRHSRTKWTWLFGDDDLMPPGSLKFIIESLQHLTKQIRFVTVQSNLYSPDMRITLVDCSREYPRDLVFSGISDFSAKFYNKFNFMGHLIFETSLWAKTANLEKYIGSQIVHVYFVLYWISKKEQIAFLNRVCIHQRSGASIRSANEMFSIIFGCLHDRKEMVYDLFKFDSERQILLRSFFYFQKFALLLFKQSESNYNLISKRDVALFFEAKNAYYFIPAFWIYYLPQLLLPSFFSKKLVSIFNAVRKSFGEVSSRFNT